MSENRKLLVWVAGASAVHAAIALTSAGALQLSAHSNWSVLRATDPVVAKADVSYYISFASRTLRGEVPYRDFPVEYPLLALPFFLIPGLVAAQGRAYVLAFAAEMLIVNAAAVWLVARWVAKTAGLACVPGRLMWYTAFVLPLGPFLIGRYDAVPTFFAFASAYWWFSGRPAWGGAAAGLGTLVKIVPGAVAVPGLMWDLSRASKPRGRGFIAFTACLAAGVAIWFAIGGSGVLASVRYHADRGLEVGSLYAGILAILGRARGDDIALVYDHASLSLSAPFASEVSRAVLPIQAAALGLVAWQFWRSGMRAPMRFAAAAVLAFAITGKVLSPQYLLWIVPFAAALQGRTGNVARRMFLAACLASAILCPWGFRALSDLQTGMLVLLNVRNALLVGLLAVLLGSREAETLVEP